MTTNNNIGQMGVEKTKHHEDTVPRSRFTPSIDAIKAESHFLLRIIDHIDSMVIIVDKAGKIARFNRACERLFGYTNEEVKSLLFTSTLPLPKEIGAIKTILSKIRTARNTEQYENEWVTRDGDVRTILWSLSFLFDENQQVEYILATGTDITSRKLAEKLLERERLLLQSLINSIPDVISYKDQNRIYLGCNSAFEAYSGLTAKDIIGHSDTEFYSTKVSEMFNDTDEKLLVNGEAVSYEHWIKEPQGKTVLFETRITPLYGQNKEIQGVIGIGRDITKNRMVENALRQSKSEIEQLVASLSSVLIVLSPDLVITRWNRMAEKIFGIPTGNVVGRSLKEIGLQWEWKKILEGIIRCAKEVGPVYLDPLKFRRVDGTDGFLGINIGQLCGNDGKAFGFILICGDITERKILETRLSQSQKLESIGQLAAGIAHEINTPIQYVSTNTIFLQENFDLLLKSINKYQELFDACQNRTVTPELLHNVSQSVERMDIPFLKEEIPLAIEQSLEGINRVSEIVTAMKDFSHPAVKEKTLLDINHALETTIAVAKNEWKYVAKMVTKFDPLLPKVSCLPGSINQVFLNLIVNAAHSIASANDNGTQGIGTICVATTMVEDCVEVRISDSGTGIPEDIQARIFEPFFTTKEVGKGSGQGLAIAYDVVVRKHQGVISFETVQGKGTSFIVRLPVA